MENAKATITPPIESTVHVEFDLTYSEAKEWWAKNSSTASKFTTIKSVYWVAAALKDIDFS